MRGGFFYVKEIVMTAVTPFEPFALDRFKRRVSAAIQEHPIVGHSGYTRWFAGGAASDAELCAFTVQFSVFSHLFLEAQLRKCINAPDRSGYRAAKEILLNELGVVFTSAGSVEGGTFRFTAGHFEWLAQFAQTFGLEWNDLGKRRLGSPSTLRFCDALLEWYGSEDESTATGASYAIEHWAAAGFWKELIAGLRIVKQQRIPDLPLGFWTWHDALEERHAEHTDDELREAYSKPGFSPERFLAAGTAMLDAVESFWNGLAAAQPGLAVPGLRER
jgi:hypothetical protein